ncbi:Hypothetical protein PACV_8 [Pacmanvirus A23]|uniref:Hypothetical protein n=1 Tax=Pacmanvirus A23 TaxID=1932881 RepID=UPI000A09375A|nr:Hypothetical protein B9W72_gp008 [Pacmanvirus A23]SIP85725.1 Hypothetical protein PACV_8 [Pacmanvirus A23]
MSSEQIKALLDESVSELMDLIKANSQGPESFHFMDQLYNTIKKQEEQRERQVYASEPIAKSTD